MHYIFLPIDKTFFQYNLWLKIVLQSIFIKIPPNGRLLIGPRVILNRGKLYFRNSVKTERTHILKERHNILGHCNKEDVLNLKQVVKKHEDKQQK